MGKRAEFYSEVTVDGLIIKRCFCGGHSKLLTVVTEISQRLHHDPIIPTDKQVKVDPHISRKRSDDLFVGEIAANRSDACLVAASGDDLG